MEGDGSSQERTLLSSGLDCRIGKVPSLRCLFRERDVFERSVMKKNRCRWDRNRAAPLSGWASRACVWVSTCSCYSTLWRDGVRRGGSCDAFSMHLHWAWLQWDLLAKKSLFLLPLMGNSVALNLAHKLTIDKRVFVIDVAQMCPCP